MKMLNFIVCVLFTIVIGAYNRFPAINRFFSIPFQLSRDLIPARSHSEALKVKLHSCHLIKGHNTKYTDTGLSAGWYSRKIKPVPPIPFGMPHAGVRIEIVQNNTMYECAWDDSSWFPDYIDSLWNYDFNAFLISLGRFLISWGDGNQEMVNFFNQSCFHLYKTTGQYSITVYSLYAFFNDEAVSMAGNLSNLKILNFANCPNLHDTPVLTGLPDLQVLDLRATGITESPVTKGMTSLQYLYFNGTAIENPPDLTTNINLRFLSFHGCNYLSVPPLVSKLTRLENLDLYDTSLTTKDLNDILYALCLNKHPNISMVNLKVSNGKIPDAAYITAFHTTYPTADLYTN
jgi:hypothetical protein